MSEPQKTAAAARFKHVDVMLAFGIVMVVLGHRYQPPFLFFPAYTFHMALFFFASGYLARPRVGLREKARFVAKKARTQLLFYFRWNLFFAVLTFLLARAGVRLGYAIPSFGTKEEVLATLRGFFLVPFLDGHQYHLFLAAWFILQLFLVHVVFQVLIWRPGKLVVGVVLAATIPTTLFLLEQGLQSYEDLRLTGVRTALAFLYFLLGHAVRLWEDRLRPVLLAPWFLVAAFALVNVLAVNLGNVQINFVLGNVNNVRVWVPVVSTLLIVLLVFQLAHHAARFLSETSSVLVIGRSTQDILVWHFTVFLGVNLCFWALGLVSFEALSDNWSTWHKEQTWLLYEVPAIALPILVRRRFERRARAPGGAAKLAHAGRKLTRSP